MMEVWSTENSKATKEYQRAMVHQVVKMAKKEKKLGLWEPKRRAPDPLLGGTRITGEYCPWRRVARRAAVRRDKLGVSAWKCAVLQGGIRDMPTKVMLDRGELGSIPQTEEDLDFERKGFEKVCRPVESLEKMETGSVSLLGRLGHMILSAFVDWEAAGEKGNGRFVQDFHLQSLQ